MTTLAALDSGTYYHHRTLYEERYRHFFDRVIYARELADTPLEDIDILLVSCRTDPSLLVPHRVKIARFLDRGGSVVAMGSTGQHLWLPGVVWHDRPTNYWWWKEGGSLGLQCADPDHPLFGRVALRDATWHYHGFFEPPQGDVDGSLGHGTPGAPLDLIHDRHRVALALQMQERDQDEVFDITQRGSGHAGD